VQTLSLSLCFSLGSLSQVSMYPECTYFVLTLFDKSVSLFPYDTPLSHPKPIVDMVHNSEDRLEVGDLKDEDLEFEVYWIKWNYSHSLRVKTSTSAPLILNTKYKSQFTLMSHSREMVNRCQFLRALSHSIG
jgi:hypothetical protein